MPLVQRPRLLSFTIVTALLSLVTCAKTVTYSSALLTNKLGPFALTLVRHLDQTCTAVSLTETQKHRILLNDEDVIVEKRQGNPSPAGSHPRHSFSSSEQVQLIGCVTDALWTKARELCPDLIVPEALQGEFFPINHGQQALRQHVPAVETPHLEVYPLVVSGPSENRVDLTFFSDGYTVHEKARFLADAKSLALDMSQNQTFATVQPLMNFWAAFSPSQESGIGVAGTPKDTVFGLYRDGTELRAVYCSKRDVAQKACLSLNKRQFTQCDYPILLGNDPLYGGLGGEFTISTASDLNGALVLRHELGHSIIGVGEEYDGGYGYFGVNAEHNVSRGVKWSHWLSSPTSSEQGPREERSIMPFQAYPWALLNTTSPWSETFLSSGLYSTHVVRFSLSGLPAAEDLKVYLDGEDLEWKPRPDVHLDRWHYDIYRAQALAGGSHTLSFALGESAREGTAQLCSAEIIEYGDENQFNTTIGYYGAFPTFSVKNTTTFRPTNEQCLMRVVTSPNLCSVCLEGLWLSLLKRVSLIDTLYVTQTYDDVIAAQPDALKLILELALIPFGERDNSRRKEFYTTVWQRDGVTLPQYSNSTRIMLKQDDVYREWRATVQLHTPEVKSDPNRLLESSIQIQMSSQGSPMFYAH